MPVAALALLAAGLVIAAEPLPAWLDTISRVGVVGFLALALYGLHRRWWVPGWAYRELEERHATLRQRYDRAIDIALRSAHGVERTATAVEEALAREERTG